MENNIEQCRTCLVSGNEMVSLQADHVVCNKVMSVLQLLKTCASVQIELHDNYPQFVCLNCTKSAEKAFEFRIQCENADNSLRSNTEAINEPIKDKCDALIEPADGEESSDLEFVEIDHYEHDLIPKTELQADDAEGEINCLDFLENASNNIEGEVELIEGYSCPICDLIFPTPQALSRHTSIKHTLNFFQCTHCPVRFISPSLLEKHLKRHTSNKESNASRKSKISEEKRKLEYICTICNRKYNYLSNLQTHIRKHIQNGNKTQNLPNKLLKKEKKPLSLKHSCEYCDKKFATSDELQKHKEKSHVLVESILPDYENSDNDRFDNDRFDSEVEDNQQEINYNCGECSKTFDSEIELNEHINTDHEVELITNNACKNGGNSNNKMLYKCKLCDYDNNQLKELKDHLQETHDVETTKIFQNLLYRCKECDKDCATIYEFFEHVTPDKTKNILQPPRKRPYICTKEGCGKAFPTPSRRNKHAKSHESQWPKKCRYCTVVVNKMYEYMMHLKDSHDDLKKFICQQCGKKFFTEKNLKSHIGVHSGERNYMCDVCGFSFQAQNNLISHRRIHTGVKPYKCTFCPKAFAQHAGLRSHLLNHTGEKNYQCTICNKKFLRVSALHSHMKTHSGIKDYMCHLCGARFGASSTRKKHLLTHTGERNHVCDFCGKAFGRKSNLTVHRKIHTGETPHVCEICGKGFIQKHVLRSHKQTHLKQQSTESSSKKSVAKKKSIIEELNLKADGAEELTVLIEIPEEQC